MNIYSRHEFSNLKFLLVAPHLLLRGDDVAHAGNVNVNLPFEANCFCTLGAIQIYISLI